jgi:hypothetical protein
MKMLSPLRASVALVLAASATAAPAFPIALLPAISQVTVFQYDASGRLTAITHRGAGNGCPNSTPTWGVGSYGCFNWSS